MATGTSTVWLRARHGAARRQGSKAFGAGWYVLNASGSKIDTD